MSNSSVKKPVGIVLVAIYTAYIGVDSFIGYFRMPTNHSAFISFLGAVFLLIGCGSLAACYGLWTMEKWGYTLTKILQRINILLIIIITLKVGISFLSLFYCGMSAGTLYYLSRPETKNLYNIS